MTQFLILKPRLSPPTETICFPIKAIFFDYLSTPDIIASFGTCASGGSNKKIRFNETINWLEDHIFSYECYSNCRKVSVIKKPLYHYFTRENEAKSLSYVKDPWVIKTAMDLEYDWKTKLNNGKYEDINSEIETNYLHNIHRLLTVLYTVIPESHQREKFSTMVLRSNRFLYKEEKIFFLSMAPFMSKIYWSDLFLNCARLSIKNDHFKN